MKPSEALEAAANIVLRDGWWQGAWFEYARPIAGEETGALTARDDEANQAGPCCQDGAISRAVTGWACPGASADAAGLLDNSTRFRVRARATHFMREHVRRVHGIDSPITWNDLASTTSDDVVAALRGAAEDAREAGE